MNLRTGKLFCIVFYIKIKRRNDNNEKIITWHCYIGDDDDDADENGRLFPLLFLLMVLLGVFILVYDA